MDILIVDDNLTNRTLLKFQLKRLDFVNNIYEADNGIKGLKILREKPVDLVLLDIYMPVMDGKQMLEEMKKDENLKNIPVIIQSTDDSQKNSMLEIGAVDFISKPIDENTLKTKLTKYN